MCCIQTVLGWSQTLQPHGVPDRAFAHPTPAPRRHTPPASDPGLCCCSLAQPGPAAGQAGTSGVWLSSTGRQQVGELRHGSRAILRLCPYSAL